MAELTPLTTVDVSGSPVTQVTATTYDGVLGSSTYDETSLYGGGSSTYDETSALTQGGAAPGGESVSANLGGTIQNISFNSQAGAVTDWRVRVNVSPAVAAVIMNNNLMSPLSGTGVNGVIFPYTPQITVMHNARYGTTPLTHSNYGAYFYEGSEVAAITLSCEFTVQNQVEGAYLMAAIQFFRTCTKMFFGQNDPLAGTPPPMVYLNGYGEAGSPGSYFPNVPCVMTNFTHNLPNDVDYIMVPVATGPTRLPVSSTLSVTLQPIYSRKKISTFSLSNFASGGMLSGGFI